MENGWKLLMHSQIVNHHMTIEQYYIYITCVFVECIFYIMGGNYVHMRFGYMLLFLVNVYLGRISEILCTFVIHCRMDAYIFYNL